ncbi:MAG: lysophospholipid acyltransferase family protein [Polyangiaceae bacterium]
MVADVREGGEWSVAQRCKNDVIYATTRSALACASRLPLSSLPGLGRALGAAAWWLWIGRRQALRNVAATLPALGEAARRSLVRATYRQLGARLGETVGMLRGGCAPLFMSEESVQVLAEARADGRGVVLASAHLGPWERVAATLATACPLTVVGREAYDARLTRVLEAVRQRAGVRCIYRGAPGAGAAMLRVLKRGEILGIPMDFRSRVPSVMAPFLGRLAPTAVGPARIALRRRARVVVATAAPMPVDAADGGADVLGAVTVEHVDTSGLAADDAGELELTTRINARLSRRILDAPDAWPWMHPRWQE